MGVAAAYLLVVDYSKEDLTLVYISRTLHDSFKQYSIAAQLKMNTTMKNIDTLKSLVQCYDNPPEIDPYTYMILTAL